VGLRLPLGELEPAQLVELVTERVAQLQFGRFVHPIYREQLYAMTTPLVIHNLADRATIMAVGAPSFSIPRTQRRTGLTTPRPQLARLASPRHLRLDCAPRTWDASLTLYALPPSCTAPRASVECSPC
jgi:hypothetical protein